MDRQSETDNETNAPFEQVKTKHKMSVFDQSISYFGLWGVPMLMWALIAVLGWDGIWVFNAENWLFVPRFAAEYEILTQHYDDVVRYKYFQFTLHSMIMTYVLFPCVCLVRFKLIHRYPISFASDIQTVRRQTKFLPLFLVGLLFVNIFGPMVLEPGEMSRMKFVPLSIKHYIVSALFLGGQWMFTYLFFLILIFDRGKNDG